MHRFQELHSKVPIINLVARAGGLSLWPMRSILALAAVTLFSNLAHADDWAIDPGHSRFGFSVPHLVVSEVEGSFHEAKGKIDLQEADPTKSSVDLSITASSIDTGNADRDKHLKGPDFFDATKYPTLTFKSTKIVKGAGKGKFKVTGDLKIRDVTKSVTLDVTSSDPITNPWGKSVRAVKVDGKIKRTDFGLLWNKTLEKGGVLVGEEVTIAVRLELTK
jgi:polyisoprenoid-binding protein YceI